MTGSEGAQKIAAVGIGVLGPVTIDGAATIARRDRIVLSALVVRRGEVIAPDQVAEAMWPDGMPDSWRKVVQGAITRLRKLLGPDAIETTSGGYRLRVGPDDVDAWRFQRLVDRAASFAETGEHDRACNELELATSLWRGEPFAELDGWAAGAAEATRMMELRRFAEERHAEERLALGEHRAVAAELRTLVAAEPLRERRWALLATGLYRSGRQGEALRALHDARRVLATELGVEPSAELVDLERAILQQDTDLDAPTALATMRAECPFKGLEAYREDDSELFFGREDESEHCCRRVVELGFLAVIGASGSGKSSLVRAGIVPRLRALGRRVTVCTPGFDPHTAFATARAAVGRDGVIVVDQGEELFTVCTTVERREAFVRVLAEHAREGAVVCTLRADHIADVASYPELARLMERSVYLLGPMDEPALRSAINGPARAAGLRLEAGLVDLLVNDVVDQPGALPLLSHALVETWRQREGRVLTVAAYRDGGGVRGAVARTAEQVYDALPERQRGAVRALFLRLVSALGDGEAIRHRLARSMLADDQNDVVDLLVQARLLTADAGSLEIAHEALARAWPRLQQWLEEDAEGHRVLAHLSAAARDWTTRGRDDDDLYRGARLLAAEEWAQRHAVDLSATERSFLDASATARVAHETEAGTRAREQEHVNRRLGRLLRAVALLLAVALVTSLVAVLQARHASRQRDRADAASRAAALERVVSQSDAARGTKRDLSALLALEAYRLAPGAATESALLGTFTGAPGFLGSLHAPPATQFWSSAFDRDGGRLVVADSTSVLRTYRIDGMKAASTITDPRRRGGWGIVATSRDGNVVAVASGTGPDGATGGDLSAYDIRTGRPVFAGIKLSFPPGAVAFSPDDALVAVGGGAGGDVEVRDAHTGAVVSRVARIPNADGPNMFQTAPVAFAGADRLVVGSEASILRIVDPRSGATRRTIATGALSTEGQLDLSPDGTRALTIDSEGHPMLWDLTRGERAWRTPATLLCNRVATAFRRGVVLCADPFGAVRTIDLATGVATGAHFDFQQGFVAQLSVSSDERTLALIGGSTVALWRLDGSGPITHVVGNPSETAVGYDVSGTALLVTNADHLRVVNPRDGNNVGSGFDFTTAVWSSVPGALAADFPDGTGGLYDVVHNRRIPGTTVHLDITPSLALAGVASNRLLLFDAHGKVRTYRRNQRVAPELDLRRENPTSAGITPDGRSLVVVWSESEADTYDVHTGARVAGPNRDIAEVAIGPRGTMVGARADGVLSLYDPRTLRPRGSTLPGGFGVPETLRFSRDDARLLVESGDRTLRLIDVATATDMGDPIAVGGNVPQFGNGGQLLRPDGKQVAATVDGGIAVWDLDPARWSEAACAIAGRNLTRSEWQRYLGPLGPYHTTCPGFATTS